MAISNKTIISPHLEVYNHHGASTSSILHRITGFFIAVPALYFFLWNAPLTLLLEDLSNQYTIQLCKFLITKNIEPLLCSKILQSIHGVNFTLSERIMFYSTHEWLVGAFYLFSILTIVMFCITVFTNNSLYALSSLAAGMIFISAFFFLLDADLLGAVQIVVYTGAVMSLYAFGMMFFDSLSEVKEKVNNPRLVFLLSGMVALIVVVVFISPILGENIDANLPVNPAYGNTVDVGLVLFTKYLVPFEVAAIMLLIAMIGGIVLAGKKMEVSYSDMSEEEIDAHIEAEAKLEALKKDVK